MTKDHGPVELRTDRLVLRPFNTGDVDDALAYASDAVWARHLPDWPQPYTRLDAEKYVSRQVSDSVEHDAHVRHRIRGKGGGLDKVQPRVERPEGVDGLRTRQRLLG